MGIKQYELSEAQWTRIEPLLPGKVYDLTHPIDNRLFVNGVLWVLRLGARWSDLPERYDKDKTVHTRCGWHPRSRKTSLNSSGQTDSVRTYAYTRPISIIYLMLREVFWL